MQSSSAPVVFHLDPNNPDCVIDISPSPKTVRTIQAESETKNSAIINPDQPMALIHLSGFEDEELEYFCKKYNKNLYQLEKQIDEFWKSYYYYIIKYGSYLICNIPFFVYRLNSSQDGLDPILQIYQPGLSAPIEISEAFGTTLAIMDFIVNMTTYNPRKGAVRTILDYANQEPFWEPVLNNFGELFYDPEKVMVAIKNSFLNSLLYQNPKQALREFLTWIRDQSVLNVYNITMSFSVISDIYNKLEIVGPVLQKGTSAILVAMSAGWFMQVTNPSYYQGLEFFQNKNNYPYLITEALNGNIALPFQVFLQGTISTVGITLYASSYYFNNVAKEITGFWLPAYITLPLSAWQLFCSMYPSTYHFYMKNGIEIKKCITHYLQRNAGNLIENEINLLEHTGLTGAELEKQKKQLRETLLKDQIKAHRNSLEAKLISEYNDSYLIKRWFYWVMEEPVFVTTMLSFIGSIGIVFGVRFLAPIFKEHIYDESISMNLLAALIGFGSLITLPLRAEQQRITDNLLWDRLPLEYKQFQEEVKPLVKNTPGEKCMSYAADVFNVGSGLATDLSVTGTGLRTFGPNPAYMTPIAIIAQQEMINKILFFGPKLRNTWKSVAAQKTIRMTEVKSAMYSQPQKQLEEKKETSDQKIAPRLVIV